MSTSKTATSGKRIDLTKYLGNVVDDTKDFVDDVLDALRSVEHDLRDTAQRTFRPNDEEEQEPVDLQRQLDESTEKIAPPPQSGRDRPTSPN